MGVVGAIRENRSDKLLELYAHIAQNALGMGVSAPKS